MHCSYRLTPKCHNVEKLDHEQIQSHLTFSYNLGWLSSKLPLQAHKIIYQLKYISCHGEMLIIVESPPNASMPNLLGRFNACRRSSPVQCSAMLISIFEASIYLCSKGRDIQGLTKCGIQDSGECRCTDFTCPVKFTVSPCLAFLKKKLNFMDVLGRQLITFD